MFRYLRAWWSAKTLVQCDSCHRLVAEYFYHPAAGHAPLCKTCYEVVDRETEEETANI